MPRPVGSPRSMVRPLATLLVLLVTGLTWAAAPRAIFRGRWIATAGGGAPLHGNWSAQALPGSANEAVGSWTLEDDAGHVTLQGTWSARRLPGGWHGRWRAKVEPAGGAFAGTWEALPGPHFEGKTFEDLLRAAAAGQIGGNWRAGHGGGKWWLTSASE